eukprot:GHVP01025859.1.p1 GENE.GHVP01025859.1~~GHVP01025859.1.p1  ORF type:complete len:1441 (-),score=287.46 GHVP01025859.1:3100-7422(-)
MQAKSLHLEFSTSRNSPCKSPKSTTQHSYSQALLHSPWRRLPPQRRTVRKLRDPYTKNSSSKEDYDESEPSSHSDSPEEEKPAPKQTIRTSVKDPLPSLLRVTRTKRSTASQFQTLFEMWAKDNDTDRDLEWSSLVASLFSRKSTIELTEAFSNLHSSPINVNCGAPFWVMVRWIETTIEERVPKSLNEDSTQVPIYKTHQQFSVPVLKRAFSYPSDLIEWNSLLVSLRSLATSSIAAFSALLICSHISQKIVLSSCLRSISADQILTSNSLFDNQETGKYLEALAFLCQKSSLFFLRHYKTTLSMIIRSHCFEQPVSESSAMARLLSVLAKFILLGSLKEENQESECIALIDNVASTRAISKDEHPSFWDTTTEALVEILEEHMIPSVPKSDVGFLLEGIEPTDDGEVTLEILADFVGHTIVVLTNAVMELRRENLAEIEELVQWRSICSKVLPGCLLLRTHHEGVKIGLIIERISRSSCDFGEAVLGLSSVQAYWKRNFGEGSEEPTIFSRAVEELNLKLSYLRLRLKTASDIGVQDLLNSVFRGTQSQMGGMLRDLYLRCQIGVQEESIKEMDLELRAERASDIILYLRIMKWVAHVQNWKSGKAFPEERKFHDKNKTSEILDSDGHVSLCTCVGFCNAISKLILPSAQRQISSIRVLHFSCHEDIVGSSLAKLPKSVAHHVLETLIDKIPIFGKSDVTFCLEASCGHAPPGEISFSSSPTSKQTFHHIDPVSCALLCLTVLAGGEIKPSCTSSPLTFYLPNPGLTVLRNQDTESVLRFSLQLLWTELSDNKIIALESDNPKLLLLRNVACLFLAGSISNSSSFSAAVFSEIVGSTKQEDSTQISTSQDYDSLTYKIDFLVQRLVRLLTYRLQCSFLSPIQLPLLFVDHQSLDFPYESNFGPLKESSKRNGDKKDPLPLPWIIRFSSGILMTSITSILFVLKTLRPYISEECSSNLGDSIEKAIFHLLPSNSSLQDPNFLPIFSTPEIIEEDNEADETSDDSSVVDQPISVLRSPGFWTTNSGNKRQPLNSSEDLIQSTERQITFLEILCPPDRTIIRSLLCRSPEPNGATEIPILGYSSRSPFLETLLLLISVSVSWLPADRIPLFVSRIFSRISLWNENHACVSRALGSFVFEILSSMCQKAEKQKSTAAAFAADEAENLITSARLLFIALRDLENHSSSRFSSPFAEEDCMLSSWRTEILESLICSMEIWRQAKEQSKLNQFRLLEEDFRNYVQEEIVNIRNGIVCWEGSLRSQKEQSEKWETQCLFAKNVLQNLRGRCCAVERKFVERLRTNHSNIENVKVNNQRNDEDVEYEDRMFPLIKGKRRRSSDLKCGDYTDEVIRKRAKITQTARETCQEFFDHFPLDAFDNDEEEEFVEDDDELFDWIDPCEGVLIHLNDGDENVTNPEHLKKIYERAGVTENWKTFLESLFCHSG